MNILNINCWRYEDHPNQQKVMENYYYRNVEHDWWEHAYDYIREACEEMGAEAEVNGFSLDRGHHVNMSADFNLWDLIDYLEKCAALNVDKKEYAGINHPAFFEDAADYLEMFKDAGLFRWRKYFDGSGEFELDLTATLGYHHYYRERSSYEWELYSRNYFHDERPTTDGEDYKPVRNIESLIEQWAEILEDFAEDVRSTALNVLRNEYEYLTGEAVEEYLKENIFDEGGIEVTDEYVTVEDIKTEVNVYIEKQSQIANTPQKDPLAWYTWVTCDKSPGKLADHIQFIIPGIEMINGLLEYTVDKVANIAIQRELF